MATKLIDHIQSEQIVKLEEDVNILKNALNLMIGDINILAPKLAPIISNLNAVASSIANNYVPLTVIVLKSLDSGNHTDGTYYDVSLMYGSGTGAKATVVIGVSTNNPSGGVHSVTCTNAGTGYAVGDVLRIPTSVTGGSSPGGVQVNRNGGYVDGLLKRVTDFDDHYGAHISRKMPPVVGLEGAPRVGFHVGGTALLHAHPEGWVAKTGTCLTATVVSNTWTSNNITAVKFVPYTASAPPIVSNQTWEGLQWWWSLPTGNIYCTNGVVTGSDFRMEGVLGGGVGNANCTFGNGWSVGDQMMSMGNANGGYTTAWFHATVTSVGTQLYPLPANNANTGFIGRTPKTPLSTVFGDPSPGQGGPAEQPDWGEGGSHHIMDPSNQLDDQEYITTVLNTGVVPSYLNQEQILFMSDDDKVKRAKKLTRMTLSRLRDASIWKTTKDVSDGVLTADDFIT